MTYLKVGTVPVPVSYRILEVTQILLLLYNRYLNGSNQDDKNYESGTWLDLSKILYVLYLFATAYKLLKSSVLDPRIHTSDLRIQLRILLLSSVKDRL
jgi:hypothetical protein